jgi:hypothetical protein
MSNSIIERLTYFSGWPERDVPHIELSPTSILCWDAIDTIRQLEEVLKAATRLRDLLTTDSDPPSLMIPEEIDDHDGFIQTFDNLATAIRTATGHCPIKSSGE